MYRQIERLEKCVAELESALKRAIQRIDQLETELRYEKETRAYEILKLQGLINGSLNYCVRTSAYISETN